MLLCGSRWVCVNGSGEIVSLFLVGSLIGVVGGGYISGFGTLLSSRPYGELKEVSPEAFHACVIAFRCSSPSPCR